MSIQDLRARLADIPGAAAMTMQHVMGRQVFGINGRLIGVDASATMDVCEQEIRKAVEYHDAIALVPGTTAPAGEAIGGHEPASPAPIQSESDQRQTAGTPIDGPLPGIASRPAYGRSDVAEATGANPGIASASSADLIPTVNAVAIAPRPSSPQGKPMTNPGGFAASIRTMMEEARQGVAQARAAGLAKVGEAVGRLNEAKAATTHVAGKMAATIEDEAASVMSELGQIANDLGLEQPE